MIETKLDIEVSTATLDDWPEIKKLHHRYVKTKAPQFIQADIPSLQSYLVNSIAAPRVAGFLTLRWNGRLIGLVALQVLSNQQLATTGLQPTVHGFIHAVYIETTSRVNNEMKTIPDEAGRIFCKKIEEWAKIRGADWIFGNVRTEKRNVGFVRKYGFKMLHQVIGKEITDG